MRCPTCKKEFHPQPDETYVYETGFGEGCHFLIQRCPSCEEIIVVREAGDITGNSLERFIKKAHVTEVIYPASNNNHLWDSQDVPDGYTNELTEAIAVLETSPKASAALSRRLLQKLLREKLGIKKRDLSQEIDEFIGNAHAPSYLTDAIDAIRHVGNFAAHPIKYENSGEIVGVEAGEAEWLIDVLKSLFDFVFVQPAKLAQRRQALNEKLKALGKPELKGG